MRPKYFALVIYTAYKAARRAVVEQSSEFISSGHSLVHNLALCSVQMYGLVKSASLSPAKPVPSLAAGLPHFTAGWARCWGRDVVSLKLSLGCSRFRRKIVADHGLVVHLAARLVPDHWKLSSGQRSHPCLWLDPETWLDPQSARLHQKS